MADSIVEQRVLIATRSDGDARVLRDLLESRDVCTRVCDTDEELARAIRAGAGAVILTEEAIDPASLEHLKSALTGQADWSALPVIVLTLSGNQASALTQRLDSWAKNAVTVLERPVRRSVLVATVELALKARRKQYDVRAELQRRHLVQDALRDSEQRLRNAIYAADVGTWRVDLESGHETRDASLNRLLGLAARDTTQPLGDFFTRIHAADRRRALRHWGELLQRGHFLELEVRIVRPDGEVRWLRNRGAVIRDSSGAPLHATGAVIDVTDRRRASDELAEIDRRKDEFIATLAHELRNPLAPMQSALDLLRLAPDDRTTGDCLTTMERQIEHLTRLIEELLDLSRISHGKIELRLQQTELSTLIRRAAESTQDLFRERRHEFSLELPDSPVVLQVDSLRMIQVIANLLSNAAKYTPEGGRVELRGVVGSEGTRITVRDNGIGISKDQIGHIFEMFTQLDRSLETGFKGLGLGLALARSMVELHGGHIDARSEGPGTGSEFTVWLPPSVICQTTPTSSRPDQEVEKRCREPGAKRQRVLVVEDNLDAARTLHQLLDLLGHHVAVAHDGPQALEKVREHEPDLVLMDIGLPGLNGYDVARRIRAQPWGKGIALAAVTGWGQDGDRRRAFDAGFDHHLTKPITVATLESVLARARSVHDDSDASSL